MDPRVRFLIDKAIDAKALLVYNQEIPLDYQHTSIYPEEMLRHRMKAEMCHMFGKHIVRNNIRMRHYKDDRRRAERVESEVFVFSRDELEAYLEHVVSHVHFIEPLHTGEPHGNNLGISDSQRIQRDTPWGEESCTFGIGTRET